MYSQLIYSPFKPLLFVLVHWYICCIKTRLELDCVGRFVVLCFYFRLCAWLICIIPPCFLFWVFVGFGVGYLVVFCLGLIVIVLGFKDCFVCCCLDCASCVCLLVA